MNHSVFVLGLVAKKICSKFGFGGFDSFFRNRILVRLRRGKYGHGMDVSCHAGPCPPAKWTWLGQLDALL